MLEEEWLSIGYKNGLIESVKECDWVLFETVYKAWFMTKINRIRPQSVDRIEVTYNKYYAHSEIVTRPVHQIDETVIYKFLNDIIVRYGNITKKEFMRIYQIINNVMIYANDTSTGYAKCVNWSVVKRYIAVDNILPVGNKEICVALSDRKILFNAVLFDMIYPQKHSASLCIVLNFYLGLRIGELASLRWQDVNLEERYIYVHTTETKAFERDANGCRTDNINYVVQDRTKTVHSVRKVPLINESVYVLQQLRQWHDKNKYDSDFLAYDGADTILSKSIDRTLRRLCELCDIPKFSSHKIRKTFASELHRNGVATKMISEIMGHAEMRTTERSYIISYDDTLQTVRNAMQKGLTISA